jgi:hypothetical protein
MGTGRATQAPKPQQYHGDLAGKRGIFLPLFVLKRLPTKDPQSGCLSTNHMGTAGSDTGTAGSDTKQKEQNAQFFETYRACMLTLRNSPEWPALKNQLDLSLKELS